MNLQDAEQFLQEQQNILENQRQQKTRRVQLAVPRLSFMSLILILRYLKTGFVYQRK